MPSFVGSIAASTISSGSSGSAMTPSVTRISTLSRRPPTIARDHADDRAQHADRSAPAKPDQERNAAAVEQALEEVAAEVVGAEPVCAPMGPSRRW